MINQMLEQLREAVKSRLPEKRMAHVLRVEEQIRFLGEMLLPEELPRLQIAALLHDIAKETPDGEQVALCDALGIPLTEKERALPAIVHAVSGTYIACRDFPNLVDEEILDAIRYHTVGKVNMSLFGKLLMLSDFTESGRTWERCRESRRYLMGITECQTKAQRIQYFHNAFYYSLKLKYEYITTLSEETDEETKTMLLFYKSLSTLD